MSGLECPLEPCRAKQRKDREAVINGAQPKQDYDPDVFPLSLPFSSSSLGGTAKCSSYVFSPHHAFLITETHTSKKWEEDRGKQDARRRRESSILPLRLSLEGEQRNPLWFPFPFFIWLLVTTDGEGKKRQFETETRKTNGKGSEKSETKGVERSSTVFVHR